MQPRAYKYNLLKRIIYYLRLTLLKVLEHVVDLIGGDYTFHT